MLIDHASDLDHRIYQRLWCNDVAQAQRGIEDLTHRSGVDHPVRIVEPLQGRQRGSGKAELRVVVVFENKCVVSTRKIEQAGPTLKTHRNAERKLMGGRYVNDPRQWFFCRSRNHDSLVVERLRNYLNGSQSKYPSRLLITGVFDPCDFTRI